MTVSILAIMAVIAAVIALVYMSRYLGAKAEAERARLKAESANTEAGYWRNRCRQFETMYLETYKRFDSCSRYFRWLTTEDFEFWQRNWNLLDLRAMEQAKGRRALMASIDDEVKALCRRLEKKENPNVQ